MIEESWHHYGNKSLTKGGVVFENDEAETLMITGRSLARALRTRKTIFHAMYGKRAPILDNINDR